MNKKNGDKFLYMNFVIYKVQILCKDNKNKRPKKIFSFYQINS